MTGWRVSLSVQAERDFDEILHWTSEVFGKRQATLYLSTILDALGELTAGPQIAGVRERSSIIAGLYTLHVARRGRKGRHIIVFQIDTPRKLIMVMRLLHDSMDMKQHISDQPDEP